MKKVCVFVVGPAGSGKSYFVGGMLEWMRRVGYEAVAVNLDPGAEFLPYEPEIDVREFVSLRDVMAEYGLGPNGAQIVACDIVASQIGEVAAAVDGVDTDYVLIDTPGQMELFAFRTASEMVVERLGGDFPFMVFTMDPMLARTPSGFVSLLLLSASVHTRFYVPFLNVLTKVDLLSDEDLDRIATWSTDYMAVMDDLLRERPTMSREMSIETLKSLQGLGIGAGLVATSAQMLFGFEDVYAKVQDVYYGGEDLEAR